jgi:Holliday junction resolvase RusA-like endonuclease
MEDVVAAQLRVHEQQQGAINDQRIAERLAIKTPAPPKPNPHEGWNFDPFDAFEFSLPWAPSVNNAYYNVAGEGRKKTSKAQVFIDASELVLIEQRVPSRKIAHPCSITITQHVTSGRSGGDIDNGIKLVLDVMKRFGIIADDNRKIVKRLIVEDAEQEEVGRVCVRIEVYP